MRTFSTKLKDYLNKILPYFHCYFEKNKVKCIILIEFFLIYLTFSKYVLSRPNRGSLWTATLMENWGNVPPLSEKNMGDFIVPPPWTIRSARRESRHFLVL